MLWDIAIIHSLNCKMSDCDPKVGRNKKSDKAKKNKELTGGLSSRHVRLAEARTATVASAIASASISSKNKKKKWVLLDVNQIQIKTS